MKLIGELRGYQSLEWDVAKRRLRRRRLLLVMDKDDLCLEIARTYNSHGVDAGMAVLCAVLYFKRNGAARTASEGVEMYADILKRLEKKGHERPWLRSEVTNLQYWMAWTRHGPGHGWPLMPPKWRNLDMVGGLANIMCWMGAAHLSDGTTSDLVVAQPIVHFLREGVRRKNGNKVREMAGRLRKGLL